MRQAMKIINLYTYNELTEQAKKIAISEFEDNWTEILNEEFTETCYDILTSFYLEDLNMNYSLNHLEEDGVSFHGNIDIEKSLLNGDIRNEIDEQVLEKIYQLYDDNKIKTVNITNEGVYNFNKTTMNINYTHYNLNTEDIKIVQIYLDVLMDYLYSLCDEFESLGYKTLYNYKEDIEEYIIDCNYEFYEDGKLFIE